MSYLKNNIECQVFRRGIPWLSTVKRRRILMNRMKDAHESASSQKLTIFSIEDRVLKDSIFSKLLVSKGFFISSPFKLDFTLNLKDKSQFVQYLLSPTPTLGQLLNPIMQHLPLETLGPPRMFGFTINTRRQSACDKRRFSGRLTRQGRKERLLLPFSSVIGER